MTLVVTHAIYHGFGPQPLVAFDLWRVMDGKIAEHWDALMPQAAQTASGHTQTDGPTAVRAPDTTAASKALIERFFATVVLAGDFGRLAEFFDGDAYIQHNPLVRDGVSGALADLGRLYSAGQGLAITRHHRTVAEGEFVLTQSEGVAAGQPAAFYDLWRVTDGKIAEHWDVWGRDPKRTAARQRAVFSDMRERRARGAGCPARLRVLRVLRVAAVQVPRLSAAPGAAAAPAARCAARCSRSGCTHRSCGPGRPPARARPAPAARPPPDGWRS